MLIWTGIDVDLDAAREYEHERSHLPRPLNPDGSVQDWAVTVARFLYVIVHRAIRNNRENTKIGRRSTGVTA